MAIIQSPWLGRSRKKLGGAVTYTADGKVIARSMPASVRNPRTTSQVVTRIILSTVSKAYAKLQGIADHSFENLKEGGKNQQRFVKVNSDLLRRLYNAAKSEGRDIGNFNAKDVVSALMNQYIISEGSLTTQVITPSFLQTGAGGFALPLAQVTDQEQSGTSYAEVCEMLGIPNGSQLTFLFLIGNKTTAEITRMKVGRVVLEPASGTMTERFLESSEVNDPNPKNELTNISLAAGQAGLSVDYSGVNLANERVIGLACIASVNENGKWKRSSQQLYMNDAVQDQNLINDAIESWQGTAEISSPLYLNQGVAEGE